MDIQALEGFGLTKNEAKVYYALIKLGSSDAASIAKDTAIHRVLVYDVLERLQEKGLVGSVTRTKKKMFEAAHPKELIDFLERQETLLKEKKQRLQQIYPELMTLYSNIKEKKGVYFFKGKRGVKASMDKFFSLNKPCYTIGSSGRTREVLGSEFRSIREHVAEKKIPVNMLYYEFARKRKDISFPKHGQVRFLPDAYRNPMLIDISGNITVLLMLDDEPFAILIENQKVADSFMQYFHFLWSIAKK